MWQIRRFKSRIFCKLKAKFNMHFKLQKEPSFPLQWSKAWMSLSLNIFWDINLQILRLESVFSYSNSIYRMKIFNYWILIYSSRLDAWRKVTNKSTTQKCSWDGHWTLFKSLKCFVQTHDLKQREAFSNLQLHDWFISLSFI